MGRSPIVYRLNNPGFTIYHRASLGGLAATIRSWSPKRKGVPGSLAFVEDRDRGGGVLRDDAGRSVHAHVDANSVELAWDEPTTDREALALILKASFRRTDEGLIYLPGQGFGPEREDLLIATHNALAMSFLQHNKKRPGSGQGQVVLQDDEGGSHSLTYKKIDQYSHQVAQASGLLSDGNGWEIQSGDLPERANVTQSIFPGALKGACPLKADPTEVFLLHFLRVGCPVFSVRSRKREAKVQSCLIVPDVTDLLTFARRLEGIGAGPIRQTNSYLRRVVGGAEEAALRFLIDLRAVEDVEALGVLGAQVYAMGDVAWDKRQKNRSLSARVMAPDTYREFAVFEAAAGTLGHAKMIKTKKGESFAVPASPLPDLIAANLAAGGRWYDGFRELVSKKKDFVSLCYRRDGLKAMQDAMQDETDKLVIRLFQEAWEVKRHALSERAVNDRLNYWPLVDGERERIRNGILRCKTPDMLLNWLLTFAADARRKEPIGLLTRDSEHVRRFLFNPRNVDRVQNLLLFALVSSPSNDPTGRAKRPTHEG